MCFPCRSSITNRAAKIQNKSYIVFFLIKKNLLWSKILSQGNEATYAEEEGEDHVVDENRLDEYVDVVHGVNVFCK